MAFFFVVVFFFLLLFFFVWFLFFFFFFGFFLCFVFGGNIISFNNFRKLHGYLYCHFSQITLNVLCRKCVIAVFKFALYILDDGKTREH